MEKATLMSIRIWAMARRPLMGLWSLEMAAWPRLCLSIS